jgi:Ca2+-transporting ATPase
VLFGVSTIGWSPFNVTQLLWINLILDVLAAIALATEPPHPKELRKERIRKTDKPITPVMWRQIISQVLY